MRLALGVDVGSVSTNLVAVDEHDHVHCQLYLRTRGNPIAVVQSGLAEMQRMLPVDSEVIACGTTGSGRQLAAHLIGADCIKNEITAHAVAALTVCKGVQTVLEIGGQDSKIIILRDGVVVDFAMNTVCAAGTGSFLDRQAARLGIDISELGPLALAAGQGTRIAGRCAVFAESDMIHKQQSGHSTEEIVRGLCDALVRNYLSNVAKGKEIRSEVVFQGGVAANVGIRRAFEEALDTKLTIPEHFSVMGAIGAGMLARRQLRQTGAATQFRGFQIAAANCRAATRDCSGCANCCEVVEFEIDGRIIARWGDRCGKWSLQQEAIADN